METPKMSFSIMKFFELFHVPCPKDRWQHPPKPHKI